MHLPFRSLLSPNICQNSAPQNSSKPDGMRKPCSTRSIRLMWPRYDYGEMIHAYDGSEEGITTFTDRGVESLKEFLADIRTWEGGVRQFLVDEQCDQEKIERIMADQPKS